MDPAILQLDQDGRRHKGPVGLEQFAEPYSVRVRKPTLAESDC